MMMKASNKTKYLLIISIIALQVFTAGFSAIPVTGSQPVAFDVKHDPVEANPDANDANIEDSSSDNPSALKEFVDSVVDGNSGVIRGIYADETFEYPVIQQPSSKPGFVSEINGIVTQFGMASQYGTTGMLAHNYLAGAAFFDLHVSDTVEVVFGDGSIRQYQVSNILSYQALSPNSATSNFVDLNTGETLTATQLFKQVYSGNHHLTLQTCIAKGSEDSWGRLFVIAEPIA
jgi:hypothetical protein